MRVQALPGGAARKPVLLLALGAFALGTDAFVISGVLGQVGGDLGVSLASAGLLITIFSATYAIGAPLLAVATGSLCRKRVLLASLVLFTAANVLAAAAPSYGVLVLARVLAALGAALYMPAAAAAAAALARPEERGRALATVLGGLTAANALGVPIGIVIGQGPGWRSTFLFVAVLGLVALAGLARALDPMDSPGVATLRERVEAAAIPGVPITLVVTGLGLGGVFVLYTYLAWFAGETAGLSGAGLTAVYLVFGVAAVASNLISGWLVDHHAPERITAISLAGIVLVFGGLAAFAAMSAGGGTVATIVLFALVACWSLVGWLFAPAQQQRLLRAGGAQGPVVLSLNASAIYAGQAVGGALGGLVLAGGPTALAAVAAGLELAALGVVIVAMRPRLVVRATGRPNRIGA